ncbi:MAG TPA: hypothetical protein VHB21_17260, partial [Minicystis sp.]|nr:hypothetical protein [Minicystis sp.]
AVDAGPAVDLAAGLGALKPTADGYAAVWVEIVEKNRAIKLLTFDPAGKPRGPAVLVAQTGDELRWVDVLPNAKGSIVVWEIPRGDRVEVDLVPIVSGKPQGATVQALKDALGWEGIATERGMAIASVVTEPPATTAASPPPRAGRKGGKKKVVVEPAEGEGTGAGKTGRVVLTELDATGHAGPPVVISPATTAQIDVELALAGGRYVFAWTDERDIDPCVYVATALPGGKIVAAPHRATSPTGEQALVSLVGQPYDPSAPPAGKRALLAWEDPSRPEGDTRVVHLGVIGDDGALMPPRASLLLAAPNGPPDLVPDGDGWAVTTLAPVPEASSEGKHGEEVPVWPAYARFGADLAVRGAEPVRAPVFGPDGVPYLTRGLSCRGGDCLTIATGSGAHAPLALVDLPARKSSWKPAAWRDADEGPPRATFVGALATSDEHVAKVASAELPGGAKLAAWVTYFVDAAKGEGGKHKPAGDDAPAARLEVRPIRPGDASLALADKPVVISQKAITAGGVALTTAPGPGNKPPETVLGWVAKERGEPQVFVTKLAPDGKKLAQKGVTVIARKQRGKNGVASEASDVTVAYDGQDGFIVAWVDTRDGNPEVYVAKVDRTMTKVIPDKRITDAPGDAADVALFVRGKETLVAWSDARANAAEKRGDIYLAHLETASLKKLGPETRLFASKEHSRSPQFTGAPEGRLLLSWIEEAPDAKQPAADPDAGLRVAQLDERANVVGSPLLVRSSALAVVTAGALTCPARPCKGVLTAAAGESTVVQAFTLEPGSHAAGLKTIGSLAGGALEDPSPSFASGDPAALFLVDDTVGGQGRVRWMQIAW